MKKIVSLVANLLLSSTLFWGVPLAYAEQLNSDEISRVPADVPTYCHIKSPAMREDSLGWTHPVFDDGAVNAVDFYGSCDYDPLGIDAVKTEERIRLRGFYGDGE
jgi:hypothetical protein